MAKEIDRDQSDRFKVGDRVIGAGGEVYRVIALAEDCAWCFGEEDDCYYTFLLSELTPIPPDPAEVLAKLERLVLASAPSACVALSSPRHNHLQRDWVARGAHGATLAEAIMAAEEP